MMVKSPCQAYPCERNAGGRSDLVPMDWPGQMEQAEQLEEVRNELHLDEEEDPRAGLGMCETEGVPGISTWMESLAGAAPDPEEVPMGIEDAGVDAESCYKPPREEKSRPPGRRSGLPHGCSEPRPQQTEIQITNEVLTILAEAALENRQMDKARRRSHRAESKEGTKCRRGARTGIKVSANGTGASIAASGNFEDEGALLGSRLTSNWPPPQKNR